MARTLDPTAHALRREAFVEAAQRLIAARGYEQLSIQDVLDDLGASKGAFYHYFDSKAALLAAVVERTVDAATGTVEPIANDPNLSALQKLEGIFSGIAQWKGERTELMLELLRAWFSDDNAIVRERLREREASRRRGPGGPCRRPRPSPTPALAVAWAFSPLGAGVRRDATAQPRPPGCPR